MRIIHRNCSMEDLDLHWKIYAFQSPDTKYGCIHILNHTPKHEYLKSHNTWQWTCLTPYGGSYGVHLTALHAFAAVESNIKIHEFENEDEFILWIIKVKEKIDLISDIEEHQNYLTEIKEYTK